MEKVIENQIPKIPIWKTCYYDNGFGFYFHYDISADYNPIEDNIDNITIDGYTEESLEKEEERITKELGSLCEELGIDYDNLMAYVFDVFEDLDDQTRDKIEELVNTNGTLLDYLDALQYLDAIRLLFEYWHQVPLEVFDNFSAECYCGVIEDFRVLREKLLKTNGKCPHQLKFRAKISREGERLIIIIPKELRQILKDLGFIGPKITINLKLRSLE